MTFLRLFVICHPFFLIYRKQLEFIGSVLVFLNLTAVNFWFLRSNTAWNFAVVIFHGKEFFRHRRIACDVKEKILFDAASFSMSISMQMSRTA
jgi:hypothetical protein